MKTYVISWSDIERGCETVEDPYTGLPYLVPTADYDEATATLYAITGVGGDREEIDSATIRLHNEEEAESETKWRQCEHMLAERNGVCGYEVETPW